MKKSKLRYAIVVSACFAAGAFAQTPDITQLRAKMQQLEQMMQELQRQINAVEQAQKTPAAPVVAAAPQAKPSSDNPSEATLPPDSDAKAHLDIYGFAMVDAGYDFKQNHPDWFDTMRPSKLPSFKDEF